MFMCMNTFFSMPNTPRQVSDDHDPGNILVVDDTPENLAILTSMLAERGYLVRPAINGEVALKAVKRNPPDLILLDIMMPRMSGFEVCETLKTNERTRTIPIIFISALHKVEDKVKAFALGGVDYITKPFQLEEVLARVETHMALLRLHRKLRANEAQLTKILGQIERAKREWEITADSLSYVVCLLDRQGLILRVNRTIEHWNLSDVLAARGQSIHAVFHPDCHDPACYLHSFLSHAWEEVSMGISIGSEEYDPVLKRYISIQLRPLISTADETDASDSTNVAVAVISDITRQKQAENSLKRHNSMLDILNQMNDQFQECRTEAETYEVVASICSRLFPLDSGALYLRHEADDLLQMVSSWGDGSDTSADASVQFPCDVCMGQFDVDTYTTQRVAHDTLCRHLSNPPKYGFLCLPIKGPDQLLGVVYAALGTEDSGTSVAGDGLLIASRHMMLSRVAKHYALALANVRLREKLRIEAIRDPLTGLYNRRYMEESLDREALRAKRRGTPVGILMFDIDHFKRLNDTYGHKAGDRVLKKLGALFRQYTRSEDVACRYGGEEFLLILPETPLEIVRQRAEELRESIKTHLHITWQDRMLSITISIGVAGFPHHGGTVNQVVSAADQALYQAKHQGRDQVCVATDAPGDSV